MNQNLKPGQFYGEILHKQQASGLILSELKHQGARKLPQHSHELAYFCLLLNGNYWEQFGPKRIDYKPLSVMFHPPATSHIDEIGPTGGRFFSVEVKTEWMNRLRECLGPGELDSSLHDGELAWLAMRLYREHKRMDACSMLTIEGLVLEMLAMVGRMRKVNEQHQPPWGTRVRRRRLRGRCRGAPCRRQRLCGEVEEAARPERPHGVGGVRRERVDRRERPPARRRVEREPAVPREPGLDPRVGLLVGDSPDPALPRAGREADGHARRDAERSQHEGHGTGVVLAVARTRDLDEIHERRVAGGCRRMLLVAEAAAVAKPALEHERRLVGRTCPRRQPAGLLPERAVRAERERPLLAEDPVHLRDASVGVEPREARGLEPDVRDADRQGLVRGARVQMR